MKQFNINVEIIKRLSQGLTQTETSKELKRLGITPNSVRTIEDKLRAMKKEFKCNTIFQLMFKVGQIGITDFENMIDK